MFDWYKWKKAEWDSLAEAERVKLGLMQNDNVRKSEFRMLQI